MVNWGTPANFNGLTGFASWLRYRSDVTCVEVRQTYNLRRLRLGEEKMTEKIERKIEEETTGQKYNGMPYYIGRP